MSAQANKKRSNWMPRVGDRVYVDRSVLALSDGPKRKLRDLFVGPFEVVKIETAVSVRLNMPDYSSHPVFHVGNLRACITSDFRSRSEEIADADGEIGEHGEEEYVVDGIVGHRLRGRQEWLWLLIKWKNYDKPTWQRCGTFMEDQPEMVRAYLRANRLDVDESGRRRDCGEM